MLASPPCILENTCMTEHSPFFDEQSSWPVSEQMTDIMQEPSWVDFCEAADEAEQAMMIYQPDDNEAYSRMVDYCMDLTEKIGHEYINRPSRVLGLAYTLDNGGITNDSEPLVLDTSSTMFLGVDMYHIDGRWQTVLEFHMNEATDDLPGGLCYVPVNKHHLMDLNIAANEQDDDEAEVSVIDLLDSHVNGARSQVYSRDFLISEPDEQRMILQVIANDIDADIPREFRDRDVVVSCTQYYTTYDDMPGFDLHDFYTDTSDRPAEERTALQGTIDSFTYPELQSIPPDQLLVPDNLTLNNGASCMVLRNDVAGQTYYILPQSINDII